MSRHKYQNWRLRADNDEGLIWVWCDSKFRIWSYEIDEVHRYLLEFVGPTDTITYIGFREEELTIKGKEFLKRMKNGT